MPVSRRNIGHRQASFLLVFNNLAGFGARTENPRVGGSIPSLATIKINFLIKGLHQSASISCPICAPVSNILVRCPFS